MYNNELNRCIEIVKNVYEDEEIKDIKKCIKMIELGRIFKAIPVQYRDLNFLKLYEDAVTSNDVDYAIAATKIPDIDKYVGLGWKRIRKICENTKRHSKISLDIVVKEFGDLHDKNNINAFLIDYKLQVNDIKYDKSILKGLINTGLTLNHINDSAIKRLHKSNNKTMTLKFIMFKIDPEEVQLILNKKNISNNDINKIKEICAFFRILSNDEKRIKNIPNDIYTELKEIFEMLTKKFNNYECSTYLNQTVKILDDHKMDMKVA